MNNNAFQQTLQKYNKALPRSRKGLTIVEMALVLVIIGLVLATIIKGGEFIRSGKIRSVVNQHTDILTAITAYREKYGALPGDDPIAGTHVSAYVGGSAYDGDGNSQITETGTPTESRKLPYHLFKADLVAGNYSGATKDMTHEFGGNVEIRYITVLGRTGNAIVYENLPADAAMALEVAIDGRDGTYNTGFVRSTTDYTSAAPPAVIPEVACFFN